MPSTPPFVSIMVPAHNEGIVIVKTVQALLALDYPADRYEIIVINDNSSDNSADLLKALQQLHPDRNLTVVNTDKTNGGKGKSNALNIGLQHARGSVISIYDADNTPEHDALRYLVAELLSYDHYGAVIGKFRTRNKKRHRPHPFYQRGDPVVSVDGPGRTPVVVQTVHDSGNQLRHPA